MVIFIHHPGLDMGPPLSNWTTHMTLWSDQVAQTWCTAPFTAFRYTHFMIPEWTSRQEKNNLKLLKDRGNGLSGAHHILFDVLFHSGDCGRLNSMLALLVSVWVRWGRVGKVLTLPCCWSLSSFGCVWSPDPVTKSLEHCCVAPQHKQTKFLDMEFLIRSLCHWIY